jgi:hypothetical protein
VEVFGLPDDQGQLVASRVDRLAAPADPAQLVPISERLRSWPQLESLSIEGFVGRSPSDTGRVQVSGLDVDLAQARAPSQGVAPGARVWVRGKLGADRTLRAEQISLRSSGRGWRPQPALREAARQEAQDESSDQASSGQTAPGREFAGTAAKPSLFRPLAQAMRRLFGLPESGPRGSGAEAREAAARAVRLLAAVKKASGDERNQQVERLARFVRRLAQDDRVREVLRDPVVRAELEHSPGLQKLLSYPRVRKALAGELELIRLSEKQRRQNADRPKRPPRVRNHAN